MKINKISKIIFFFIIICVLEINLSHAQNKTNFKVVYLDDSPMPRTKMQNFNYEYFLKNKLIQIYFGNFYINTRVKLLSNKKVIFENIINTNASLESCDDVIFLKSNKRNLINVIFEDKEISFKLDNIYIFKN